MEELLPHKCFQQTKPTLDGQITMEFLPSSESDKEYFRTLNKACYEEVVSQQFGPWDQELQQSNFETKWKEQKFNKILLGEKVVGAFWVQELEGAMQLREIQIHPDYQGQGIGTSVIKYVIEQSRKAGKNVFLKVLFKNEAFKLYKRLGFVETGKNEHQYEMQYYV